MNYTGLEIAVIGLSCKFPDADNIEIFWENIRDGKEAVKFSSHDELIKAGFSEEFINNPNFVKSKGCVYSNKKKFDASFFDFTNKEADILDPQFRILLECVWDAIEHAGYNPYAYKKLIGLYVGADENS